VWKPHNLHAEVAALLPEMYWAAPIAPTVDMTSAYDLAIYLRELSTGQYGRYFIPGSRPAFQLRIVEVMRPDRFDTVRHIRGRLTTIGHLDWHNFPTLEAAIASLTTQHRLGVGNA
jgi:hypothetical protein